MVESNTSSKHEAVRCPRCDDKFFCIPGAISICHCFDIALSREQREYIAERWQGCLCGHCLTTLAGAQRLKN
ncbi:cysteine-rich CWC family protein [Sediminihaliea albiluteola]|nr:cysteine-rich CWC family protein [Sediminihaliea albiluteola]